MSRWDPELIYFLYMEGFEVGRAPPRCVVLGRNLSSHDTLTHTHTLSSGASSLLFHHSAENPQAQSTPRRVQGPDHSARLGRGHPWARPPGRATGDAPGGAPGPERQLPRALGGAILPVPWPPAGP